MEELTEEVEPEEEVKEKNVEHVAHDPVPAVENVDVEKKIEAIEEKDVSQKAESEHVEEKPATKVEEEIEKEAGEEEVGGGEPKDKEDLAHPKAGRKMSDQKPEAEFQYVKKKKPEPKVRRVDMDEFYPDESKSSMDEKIVTEGAAVEGEAVGVTQEIDDSEDLIDPTKDYTKVDPSFLDEFLSTEEEPISEAKLSAFVKKTEAFEEVEEEEDDFQQEIYVQPPDREPSDRVYDQICDLETPVSSDESFKVPRFRFIPRRKSYPTQGFCVEDNKWLAQTQSVQSVEVPSTALLNLMDNIAPALKKALMEIAMYQPSNAVYYLTHSLLHKAKTPEEIGLEPDPHHIQAIVDGQKKKRKQPHSPIRKQTDIFLEPLAESQISTPHVEVKADVPISDDDDEDPSQLHKFQRKYRKEMKKIVTEEKAKRSNLDRNAMRPGMCLGPTSLPFIDTRPPEAVSKVKSVYL